MSTAGAEAPCTVQEYEALLQFLYMAPIGLAQTSFDGEIALINPLCGQLLMPLSRDGSLTNLFEVLRPLAPDLAFRAQTFAGSHGKICDAVQLQVDAGLPGTKDPQVLSLTLFKLDGERLMAVLDDISLAVKRERELRRSQAWIHTLAHGTPSVDYALIALDHDGRIKSWNEGIGNLTGMPPDDTSGRSYATFYADDDADPDRAAARLAEADATGWNLEEGWLRRGESRFWGSCLITPAPLCGDMTLPDRRYNMILRDISDHREANEALRRSIWTDHLTGLANRRAFFDASTEAVSRCAKTGQPLCAILFDADHFKGINDTYGHPAGDAVLRHLAAALQAAFGVGDVVSRFGGEEFVVLLPGRSLEAAAELAERFRARCAATPVPVAGVAVTCTVSAGVAGLLPGDAGVDALLRRADMAMYAAKREGRDRVCIWRDDMSPAGVRGRNPGP